MVKLRPLLLIIALLGGCGLHNDAQEASRHIDAVIKRLEGGDKSVSEFADARKLHFIDVNGDGEKDVVALFTLEGFGGGNGYSTYLTVLIRRKEGFRELGTLRIGGKGLREIEADTARFSHGVIELDTREYGPEDPMCCPTVKGSARFTTRGGLKPAS